MGKVTAEIILVNHYDEMLYKDSKITAEQIRRIDVPDAVVDSGATMLSLNREVIKTLGLEKSGTKKANTADGIFELDTYSSVRLKIGDREGLFEVMELRHPKIRALIGQIPLEVFDLLIHPGINRLIPNPFHDNQLILDQLLTEDILSHGFER